MCLGMDRYHRYTEYHSNNAMGITYTNLVEAERKCVQKYFCCKRTLAIVTYVDQFSVHRSAQSRLGIPCTVHAIWGQLATQHTWIIQSRSAGESCRRCRNGLLIMWLFESTRIRNSYFFFIWFIFYYVDHKQRRVTFYTWLKTSDCSSLIFKWKLIIQFIQSYDDLQPNLSLYNVLIF